MRTGKHEPDKHFNEMWRFVIRELVNIKFSKNMQKVLARSPAIQLDPTELETFSKILKEAVGDLETNVSIKVRPHYAWSTHRPLPREALRQSCSISARAVGKGV